MVDMSLLQEDSLNHHNSASHLFQEATRIFLATRSVQPVYSHLLQETAAQLGAEGSFIWLLDDDSPEELICQATYHVWLDPFPSEQRLHLGEGVAGQVALTGKSIIRSDISGSLLTIADAMSLGTGTALSLLAVPLISNESQIGVLEFINKVSGHTRGQFTDKDLWLAESLAGAVADAISNVRFNESLLQQVEALQIQNEDLDAFAHSVAHDLQNPLYQVIGFAELLKFKLDDLSDKDRLYAVDALVSSANKMSSIIQELLLLASVEKTEIPLEPLIMEVIVADAVQRLEHLIADHQANLVLPKEWPPVLGYAPWVEEVWENYLSNAIKYGGSPPQIELGSFLQPDGMVQFWIRDNGEGFAPEVENRLFAPFTQLRQTAPSADKNGHGLGLSIVRRIVEKLGGVVTAECIQGQGSVFSFTLPALRETRE